MILRTHLAVSDYPEGAKAIKEKEWFMSKLHKINEIKKLRLFRKPINVDELSVDMKDEYEDRWLLEAEKIETKKIRQWRQQLSS